jgi:hypothetical protein
VPPLSWGPQLSRPTAEGGDKRGKYMYKLVRQQCLASDVPLRKDDQAGSRIQVGSSPHFRTALFTSALWCRTV